MKIDIHHLNYDHHNEGNQAEADDCIALCAYHHTLIHCDKCGRSHELHIFENRQRDRLQIAGEDPRQKVVT